MLKSTLLSTTHLLYASVLPVLCDAPYLTIHYRTHYLFILNNTFAKIHAFNPFSSI